MCVGICLSVYLPEMYIIYGCKYPYSQVCMFVYIKCDSHIGTSQYQSSVYLVLRWCSKPIIILRSDPFCYP